MSTINEFDFITIDAPLTSAEGESKSYVLEPDMYNATCVGLVLKEMQNFDKTALQDKMMFVFQIIEDGTTYYIKSAPFTLSLHTKSALWKFVSAWTKQPDPQTLAQKMGNGSFDPVQLLGKPIRLTIDNREYNGKTYNNLKDCLAPSKGQEVVVDIEGGYPEYLVKDCKKSVWVKGLTMIEPKTEEDAEKPVELPKLAKVDKVLDAVVDTEEDGDLPF